MELNEATKALLAIKFAKGENLSPEEMRTLKQWWEVDPNAKFMCEVFKDGEKVRMEDEAHPERRQARWKKVEKLIAEKIERDRNARQERTKAKRRAQQERLLSIFKNLFKPK